MSAAKENPCRKFQANIFNKSKCQNCFKPRESHLLNDEDLTQAKPIYGGWLLLAPDGTDFDNPVHRSRKWQRRFFILYEHGLLRYALDEMPTTLPQGTINMNQCTDVVDGEARTGQKFSLCILTPDKEHFIRAETKEIISGWLEMLMVYPRTNKQNQKKKRKVEPPTPQEPGPAKMAVTSSSGSGSGSSSSSIPSAEKVPTTKSTLWQEEMRAKDQPDVNSLTPAQSPSQSLPPAVCTPREIGLESKEDESTVSGDRVDGGRKVRVESGYFSLEKAKQDLRAEEQLPPPLSPPSPSTPHSRRSQVIEKFEALDIEKAEHMETNMLIMTTPSSDTRQGRSEKRAIPRKRDFASEAPTAPLSDACPLSPHRRAKSLDRRSTESSMTPDLLNFKKGWLTKQYEDGQWKKHWFVLADQSLRYYRDSMAEEAADLDGEIDLSTCYNVTEYPVQRNYGFQIHTKEGEFTLSAMTSGIRRNWIQTIMKHVLPASAPDVTSSLPEEKNKSTSSFETCPRPNEKQEAEPGEPDPEQKKSRARERRREGRSKTFDWAEFRPIQQALAQERASTVGSSDAGEPGRPEAEPGELERERARRREERRKRFGMLDTVDGPGVEDTALRMDIDRSPGLLGPPDLKTQNVHVEIEQRWHQVETTPLREEKQVPIAPLHLSLEDRSERLSTHELTSLLEKELEQSQKEASDLLEQNRLLQDQLRVALGREQSAREGYVLQTEVATSPSGAWQRLHRVNQDLQSELEAQCRRQELVTQQIQTLKHSYGEAKDAIRHHEAEIQTLQARLGNAAAELALKEQALAELKGELKLEQGKVREQLEEWRHSKAMLSGQLRASEQKLKSTEALLLEKTQELRGLETQQALQRDRQKEVQRLQECIAELSQQLGTSEQAQNLMEKKLKRNYTLLLESCEQEKQALLQNLKEVEDKASAYEEQLQGHVQQVEALQKEKLSEKCKGSEQVQLLEEELEAREASIRQLAQHVQSLHDERDLIKQQFQELMERVATSDGDVAELQEKLRGKEADYQNLEHSHHRVSIQLQSVRTLLREKEEELKHIKEAHERVLEKKDQDLNEALLKMIALGSSLEETEIKLQEKEECLRRFVSDSPKDAKEPQSTTEQTEDGGILPLGSVTRVFPGFLHSQPEDEDPGAGQGEECSSGSPSREENMVAPKSADVPDREGHLQCSSKSDQGAPLKRPRIRFSTIQCQRYIHPEGCAKAWTSSTSSDTSQDQSPSEDSVSSEATPSTLPAAADAETYISIIHSLETKLYVTEEKLKDVTVRLESQQGQSQEALLALHQQWAGTEAQLREQLHASLLQASALASQLEQERQEKTTNIEHHSEELEDFQVKNSQALTCLENCWIKLRSLPFADQEEGQDACAASLANIESMLVSAIKALQPWASPIDSRAQTQQEKGHPMESGPATTVQQPCQPILNEQEHRKLLSAQIVLEASLINQIADSLKNTTSDVYGVLCELTQSGEWPLKEESAALSVGAPVEIWAKKVLVNGEFWSQVESLSKHLGTLGEETACTSGDRQQHIPKSLADATWIRAELSYATQSLRELFHHRLQSIQETLQGTQAALQQHKCMLGEILGAYQTPDFERVIQQILETLRHPTGREDQVQTSWDQSPLGEVLKPGMEGSQEPLQAFHQSPEVLAAIQDELAQQLREKASILEEISAALPALPPTEQLGGCQRLLQMSQHLSYDACLEGLGQYSSLLVQDAIIQAQVCYAACRIRLEYEKELRFYKKACQEATGGSCQKRAQAVGALKEEYEELLHKQKSEYQKVITLIEKENTELKAKVSQMDHQQRCLQEAESKHSESMFALQGRYEEEIRCMVEQLSHTENTLQAERSRVLSQLDASVKDRQAMEQQHVQQMKMLEDRFQLKVRELQAVHQEELRALQEHYVWSLRGALSLCQPSHADSPLASRPSEPRAVPTTKDEAESMTGLRERIQELEAQMDVMREELGHKELEGDVATLREKYQRDFESLKATCERGFAAMEETHQKKIEDLQRQHQRELEKLREEKDRLLAEETAATISAIEAMKNAHREEMERELEKSQRSQISSINSDIEALRRQYLEELQSVQRELEVLSEQYSQKCLENAHLAQALEAERQALRQCQRENQELNAHNQELNNRLAAEITRLRTLLTGDGGGETTGLPLTQGKDAYELEVLLRVKESEIQYLKQEISSLKDELQTALRDKKYASDKYKDIYTELSIAKAKADCDISRLKEQLKAATEALGEKSPEGTAVSGYDIMKSKSNPDFLKKDRSCVTRQLRNIRSKSLKEGLTVQERLKLFESRDLKKD
ncbi:myosin phosphatase Rho-interacting protein isoform X3 [Mesocricetus auratus]|uniref:Myosin phosphatase Rho-interacting protein isoform X3 n=1 Tax=Mesocricetus auratus TaxID=10036 RepID=A0ABM2XPN7_MESAU|nr:myosin phosphatase Rho-interacting protein isoform X3 [Mesocricetus auratus]